MAASRAAPPVTRQERALPPELFEGRAAIGAGRRLLLVAATAISMARAPTNADGAYFRAGVGVDRPVDTVFTDRDCSSTSPAALYGCARRCART